MDTLSSFFIEAGKSGVGAPESDGKISQLDQIAEQTASDVDVDSVLISLVKKDRLFSAGSFPQVPINDVARRHFKDDTVCATTLSEGRTIALEDARRSPKFASLKYVEGGYVTGYLGVPIFNQAKEPIGAMCMLTNSARTWQLLEKNYLLQAAKNVELLLNVENTQNELLALFSQYAELDEVVATLSSNSRLAVSIYRETGELLFMTAGIGEMLTLSEIENFGWNVKTLAKSEFRNTSGKFKGFTVSCERSSSGLVLCNWYPKPGKVV